MAGAGVQFYEGLEADNSKTYWAAHHQVYDEMVLGPMTALLAELSSEFGPGRVFRPNRDVRFSTDKSPYKLHIGATLGHRTPAEYAAACRHTHTPVACEIN